MASGDTKPRGNDPGGASPKPVPASGGPAKPKLKIWILSDLHLGSGCAWDLPSPRPDFDVLVLAGDLVCGMERGVAWLKERITDRHVVYVCGTREAEGADLSRTIENARNAAAGSNVHVMENDVFVIGNVRFAACTLWTDWQLFADPVAAMRVAAEQVSAYKKILTADHSRSLRPRDTLVRHEASCSFLATALAKPFSGPTVACTHHSPARRPGNSPHALAPDLLEAASRSDLRYLVAFVGPELWIHGRVHESTDVTVGCTRVVANPRGYHDALNPSFDPLFTLEV